MMTQQLTGTSLFEGLFDLSPKAVAEEGVEGDPFAAILAQVAPAPDGDAAPDAALAPLSFAAALKPAGLATRLVEGEGAEAEETAPEGGSLAQEPETAEPPLLALLSATPAVLAPAVPTSTAAVASQKGVLVEAMSTTAAAPAAPQAAPETAAPPVLATATMPLERDARAMAKAPQPAAQPVAADEPRLPSSVEPAAPAQPQAAAPAPQPAPVADALLAAISQPAPATPLAPGAVRAEAALPVEQIIEQHLDMAHEGEWLDRLARDIAHGAGKDGALRFRLDPEHLGSLRVELTQNANGASIRLLAETEAARAILADAQPRLVAEARAQGVRIAETHVDLGGGAGGHHAAGDQRGQRDLRGEGYLRTFKPEASDGAVTAPEARHAADRYA